MSSHNQALQSYSSSESVSALVNYDEVNETVEKAIEICITSFSSSEDEDDKEVRPSPINPVQQGNQNANAIANKGVPQQRIAVSEDRYLCFRGTKRKLEFAMTPEGEKAESVAVALNDEGDKYVTPHNENGEKGKKKVSFGYEVKEGGNERRQEKLERETEEALEDVMDNTLKDVREYVAEAEKDIEGIVLAKKRELAAQSLSHSELMLVAGIQLLPWTGVGNTSTSCDIDRLQQRGFDCRVLANRVDLMLKECDRYAKELGKSLH